MSEKPIKPLSNIETAAFCSQMAMILRSGISSIEGVSIMLEDASDAREKELLTSINETLLNTGSFYLALEDTHAFPDYMVHMVELGEQAGKLDNVMDSLANYYEKEASLSQTIKTSVTYPFLMIIMMILVILVLITKVMPVFNQVFQQLGTEMTGISLALLQIGEYLSSHAFIFIAVLVVLGALFFYLFKTNHGQKILRGCIKHIHGIKNLSDQISSRRFASGMALTLSSGLTPQECLHLTSNLVDDPEFVSRLKKCEDAVAEGNDLCETLFANHIFSGLYAKMASIGSRTGVLDEVMEKIATQYEEDIDARLSGLIAAIEPTLVIILSVIVGIILLSVMLPLISIMAGL